MAGYNALDLGFAPVQSVASDVGHKLVEFFAASHGLDVRSIRQITKIVLNDHMEWVDSVAVRVKSSLQDALHEAGSAWSIPARIAIGQAFYPIRIQLAPAQAAGLADTDGLCVNLKLGSTPYEAVFRFNPRDEGYFDDEAKTGLLKLSLGAAGCLRTETLMLGFDEADFVAWPAVEVKHRLLQPELTMRGRRPGLLTGISTVVLDYESLCDVWGIDQVIETGGGYVLLDDLVRNDPGDPD